MNIDRMLCMDCAFMAQMKLNKRGSNAEWAANLSLGYV